MIKNFCPSYPLLFLYNKKVRAKNGLLLPSPSFLRPSILHEDVTSTTFTLLATTLSSAWKRTRTTLTFRATTLNPAWRRYLYDPPLLTTTLLWLQICL